ncbi:MAG: peptidase and in kexin sedolisin [Cyanobacteria bacterium RYN_339]|nr:peptidase and in kexin sedolisin [Cyanobacteria bacterium RYN_339]
MTDPRINSTNRPTQPLNRPRATGTMAAPPSPTMAGDGGNVSDVTRTLAGLKGNDGMEAITAGQWQAVLKTVNAMPPAQIESLKGSLLKQGLLLKVNRDAGEVSLFSGQGAVTGEPTTGQLRVTLNGMSTIYKGTAAVETITVTPEKQIAVTRDGKTQLWDPRTGQGSLDGKPIPPRFAEAVKGEGPRKPWATPPASKLVEPDGDNLMPEFQKAYDEAVRASGGEVVEPMALRKDNEPERYNCHSFATTGAHGDLGDPFDRVYAPRWVNYPTYQLANGPFKQLKPDQKVHVGDVIMYQKDGVPTHTGKVLAVDGDGNPTRVESKWGAYGLYKHGTMDVPAIYGEIGGFYRPE